MVASRAITIAFIVSLCALCVLAQSAPQAAVTPETSVPTGSIIGQVVDENGQPVKGATVQIAAVGSNAGRTVITDRQGQFQVDGLAPLEYGMLATMPSYFPDPERRSSRSYRIGDRVTLTLIKGGVVTGKVTDANGDPVVMVNVRARLVRLPDGRSTTSGWEQVRPTDDRGIYRIYGLLAGSYVISAGGPGRSTPMSSDSVFEFDVATYAPSSTRETAAEISVRLGEETTNVDIRYRGEQGRIISGEVTAPAKSHRSVGIRFITDGEPGQYGEMFHRSEDKTGFVFKGVADGTYTLFASSSDPEGEVAISELKQVSVQGTDVTELKLATKVLGSVSGRVVLDEARVAQCINKENPLSTETSVFAWYRDDVAAKQIPQFIRSKDPARPDEKGNFLLRNLVPGAYHFGTTLKASQWYVRSILFVPPTNATTKTKQVDATRVWTNVEMSERLPGLTITLAQGGATLRGEYVLAPGERAPAGSLLYLAPAERENANDVLRYFATPIGANGYFELKNIAPGRYWVLAQLGGEESAAQSPKVRLPHETAMRAQIRREAEAAKIEIEFKPCQNIVDYRLSLKPTSQ